MMTRLKPTDLALLREEYCPEHAEYMLLDCEVRETSADADELSYLDCVFSHPASVVEHPLPRHVQRSTRCQPTSTTTTRPLGSTKTYLVAGRGSSSGASQPARLLSPVPRCTGTPSPSSHESPMTPSIKSIVRQNLLTEPGYSPYCGNHLCASMPRTRFNGEQFECPSCGWTSSFEPEFIDAYNAAVAAWKQSK